MKTLKLAILPVALLATSAFAHNHEVVEPVAYNAENGIIKNTTTQLVEGTKTFFNKATKPAVIGAEVGTLGYGGHIAWGVSPKADLVAGWNGGNLDFDVDIGGDDSVINWDHVLGDDYEDFKGNIEFKADMNNPYLGVRLRPWANNFNIGTGVIFNDNKFSVNAKVDPDLTPEQIAKLSVHGKSIPAGAEMNVSTEQKNTVAPYLTLGFAPSTSKRWGFFGEVGVAYTGNLKTSVTTNSAQLEADGVDVRELDEAAEEVRKEIADANLEWHPIVKAGVTVRF